MRGQKVHHQFYSLNKTHKNPLLSPSLVNKKLGEKISSDLYYFPSFFSLCFERGINI